ncbi:hypothetical protein [Streptomyces sp. NPDC090029]|uniref:hypothetical protein n=1 Tax=Streptomyces sp. NPDC090029 TaxID=3365924 RepID=UPI00380E5FF9
MAALDDIEVPGHDDGHVREGSVELRQGLGDRVLEGALGDVALLLGAAGGDVQAEDADVVAADGDAGGRGPVGRDGDRALGRVGVGGAAGDDRAVVGFRRLRGDHGGVPALGERGDESVATVGGGHLGEDGDVRVVLGGDPGGLTAGAARGGVLGVEQQQPYGVVGRSVRGFVQVDQGELLGRGAHRAAPFSSRNASLWGVC